jgi:thiol-disulfide isomerase/thioredoxin
MGFSELKGLSFVRFLQEKLIISLALLFVINLSTICFSYSQSSEINEYGLPDFKLTGLDGDQIQNKDLIGKVVVIDFWATWCAPCIKSFPAMIEVQNSFASNENVIFLYVNTLEFEGRDEEFIMRFLEKKGIDVTVYLDQAKSNSELLSERLGISTLPYKMIIDKSGVIRYSETGYLGSHDEFINDLQDKINSLLEL